jgi:hypothetical protein
MTGLELFAFVILPMVIVAGGAIAAALHKRSLHNQHRTPAE